MKYLLILGVLASLPLIAHGETLLNDTFSGIGELNGTTLNSSSPDAYSITPETWTADSSITTDGTSALLPTPSDDNNGVTGYIGIPSLTDSNLTVGSTYTLSFTLTPPTGTGWTAAGFGTEDNTAGEPHANGNLAGFWALYNPYGDVAIVYGDGPTGNSNNIVIPIYSGNVDITLTVQVGASSDTLGATVDGNTELSGYNTAIDPVSQVFIGNAAASGSVEDLSLDGPAPVPEPGTWVMLLGGAGALLLVQRLRRRPSF